MGEVNQRVRVTFRKQISDGNYGSETAEVTLEYEVEPGQEQTDYAESLLMQARHRVHAELMRSPSRAVRLAVEALVPQHSRVGVDDEDTDSEDLPY